MDSDKLPEFRNNRVKELHSNIRHITQLGMGWFAFFVTVNYAAMSWLAKGSGADPVIVQRIAVVFIVQDLLGVFGLTWVLVAAWAMKIQVSDFENPASHTPRDVKTETKSKRVLSRFLDHLKTFLTSKKWKSESIPNHLYIGIGVFLMMVLISLIWAWTSIAWHYDSK